MSETTTPTAGPTAVLAGSRCRTCDNVAFPVATGCQRCGGHEIDALDLSRVGLVWAHTVQRFAPKSPPYVPPAEGFQPFAVGYVELPEGIRVEAVLESDDPTTLHGAQVHLVATSPVPRFATEQWLAARPSEQEVSA